MINLKKTREINTQFLNTQSKNLKEEAFGIYKKLMTVYDQKDLFLFESLGLNSIESQVSMIGVDSVLSIEVVNCEITFIANNNILNRIAEIYSDEKLLFIGHRKLQYRIDQRKLVWNFLRKIDQYFRYLDGGVYSTISLSYNTIHFVESISGYQNEGAPDIYICCYACCIEINHDSMKIHRYEFVGEEMIDEEKLIECIQGSESNLSNENPATFFLSRETNKQDYLKKVEIVLDHVARGEVYQVQVGQRIEISIDIHPIDVYSRIRTLNPSPYMYLFGLKDLTVIGASPELFIHMKGGKIRMKPIAGTFGKGAGNSKEHAIHGLHSNKKEVAEHLMLVDLCRNDLYKVANPETLEVSGVMEVEEYSHVYHMVSTVEANVMTGFDKYDAIQAAFPAGTMTGTPKIRAVELISEIEDSGRGLYAGALGMIGLGSEFLNTALCIRTAIEKNRTYSLRASAGIVSDSIAEKEHAETLQKMASMFQAVTGEEIACHLE
jgi:anthranilate synthase component I